MRVQRPTRTHGRRTEEAGAHSPRPNRSPSSGSQGAYGGQLQPGSPGPVVPSIASTWFLVTAPAGAGDLASSSASVPSTSTDPSADPPTRVTVRPPSGRRTATAEPPAGARPSPRTGRVRL